MQQLAEREYPVYEILVKKDIYTNDTVLKDLNFDNRNAYMKGLQTGLEMDRWIPVSERLPEEGVAVIIQCTGHRVSTTGYIHKRGHWIISNQEGSTYKESNMHIVTHWQPLPPKPKSK